MELFQYFPTKVVQIDSEWPFLGILELFQYFPTKVVQINSEGPVLTVLSLFQHFPTEVVQIDLEWPIWPSGIFYTLSQQSALKLFEIATKVIGTNNFHFKCQLLGNITPYGPWGTVLGHLQKYIGG